MSRRLVPWLVGVKGEVKVKGGGGRREKRGVAGRSVRCAENNNVKNSSAHDIPNSLSDRTWACTKAAPVF